MYWDKLKITPLGASGLQMLWAADGGASIFALSKHTDAASFVLKSKLGTKLIASGVRLVARKPDCKSMSQSGSPKLGWINHEWGLEPS